MLVRGRGGCQPDSMETLYDAAGGMDGMVRLAHAWHERVLADEVVSHAFSHGFHPDHTQRLAAYWAEALGGPAWAGGDESRGGLDAQRER